MTKEQLVLVVDRSEETCEVLQTALARRGVRTCCARRVRRGLELAEQIRPDVVVLDLELEGADPEAVCAPFALQSRQNQTGLVLLGSIRRPGGEAPVGEFLRKPYDFGPLVRKIEELLVAADSPERRAA